MTKKEIIVKCIEAEKEHMFCPECKEPMTLGYRCELIWYPDLIGEMDHWDVISDAECLESFFECFSCGIKRSDDIEELETLDEQHRVVKKHVGGK